jgi:hypothetical protein
MRYAFVVAVVFAVVCACAGSFTSSDTTHLGTIDASIGSVPVVASGGGDGGDAGDGGTFDDGGCAATPINSALVIDGCGNSALSTLATVSLNPANCSAIINFSGSSAPCTGTISGANDAFDGGCSGAFLTGCTSLSLPGRIDCTQSAGSRCSISVCDADAGICTL